MIRIDSYPTHELDGIKYRIGKVLPYGASIVADGVNFSVFSSDASYCELLLYHHGEMEPYVIIPFPESFRIGNVFSMIVFDIDFETVEYGYRMDGPYNPEKGYWFDKNKILLDPYAKSVSGRTVWGQEPDYENPFQHRGRIIYDDFDWQGDKPLEIPMKDLIIYEAHVRSFTKHASSKVKYAGTFAGLRGKIPYLKELGVNCIELLPIFEFDEFENARVIEEKRLFNYWGYSTVCFFSPKAGYASSAPLGLEVEELKNLVKELHRSGIELILDVVFNHTAEGNEKGPYISYRGIDNKTYYLLTPEGYYYNFSGCGNTLNCNNPIVRNCILDCLRYWASEYHIDGFRFDLASILSRDKNGAPMSDPPLLEALAYDAILGKCKLIAEAWDAGGLYQVGSFPSWGRWAEWNGRFRDTVRQFIKGEASASPELYNRLNGSQDMYGNRSADASINFITCHDGFTLNDLVSYNEKHNEANGENNNDGCNDNASWNCGVEGDTDDLEILALRKRQMKNAAALLLLSRGIPMLLSGDEFGNTQHGNNNAYCHDNAISWLNWDLLDKNNELFLFFKKMIQFRKMHPVLRNVHFDTSMNGTGYPEFSLHGEVPWQFNPSQQTLVFGFLFVEDKVKYGTKEDTFIYTAVNAHWESHTFTLPVIPEGKDWYVLLDTYMEEEKIYEPGNEKKLKIENGLIINPRSIVVLVSK
ncbi:MAG: glycogen debranching protein GlgX [Lachnospiraceae bacterium]|nr:glycogen debranching protein GlgX [Lachnospiraceae bacterium]